MLKVYFSEPITFLYTPSHQALTCLDLALTKLSEEGLLGPSVSADVTSYFPDLAGDMSCWDKVGEIKKHIKDIRIPTNDEVMKIRGSLAHFHKKNPEYLQALEDIRTK
jgi:hypothetical protein